MATNAPALPTTIPALDGTAMQIENNLGLSATLRLQKLKKKITSLRLAGAIKPATILNLSPFPLKVEAGPIVPQIIPPRPLDKKFHAETIRTIRHYTVYKGNREMSDKSLRREYDIEVVLPIQQLMEFKHFYIGETEEDKLVKQGGVVVFEGVAEDLRPNSIIRVPRFLFQDMERFLVFDDCALGDAYHEAEEQMKNRFFAVLEDAGHDADDPQKRKNITRYHHSVADFCLAMKWIQNPPSWRDSKVRAEDCCPRCNAQYVSKTGMCKCSYVYDPFTAFMSGEITNEHVRMQTLNAEQWKKVKIELKRRQEAMGTV